MGAFDLRVRPRGCRDPLTNKQVTVRYDSHRKLISRCPSECFRGFLPETRCGRYGAFQSPSPGVSLCLTRTTEQHS